MSWSSPEMLIMAGDRLDYDELARWAQDGYERASAQRHGPTDPNLALREVGGQSSTGESCPDQELLHLAKSG
jgi:hypothetical protein